MRKFLAFFFIWATSLLVMEQAHANVCSLPGKLAGEECSENPDFIGCRGFTHNGPCTLSGEFQTTCTDRGTTYYKCDCASDAITIDGSGKYQCSRDFNPQCGCSREDTRCNTNMYPHHGCQGANSHGSGEGQNLGQNGADWCADPKDNSFWYKECLCDTGYDQTCEEEGLARPSTSDYCELPHSQFRYKSCNCATDWVLNVSCETRSDGCTAEASKVPNGAGGFCYHCVNKECSSSTNKNLEVLWCEHAKSTEVDCETLGYTKQGDCPENTDTLTCPFNAEYKFCQEKSLGGGDCFVSTAEELAQRASDGSCTVVTLLNDITIPEDLLITVARGTTINGQDHLLTVNGPNKKGVNVFTLLDGSGLANLHIKWSAGNNTADNQLFGQPREIDHDQFVTHPTIYMHNLDITVNHNNPTPENNSNFGVFGGGYFYYDGKISVHAHATKQATLFRAIGGEHYFRNADVDLSMKCDSEKDICLLFSGNVFTFENSSLHAEATETMFCPADRNTKYPEMEWEPEGNITLINTVATFDHVGTYPFEKETTKMSRGMLFKGVGPKIDKEKDNRNNNTFDLYVLEGSVATLKTKNTFFTRNVGTPHRLKLMGTEKNPAKLIMDNVKEGLKASEFTAGNPTDTFILNGTTYHPLKESTHKFTELDQHPEDWQKP